MTILMIQLNQHAVVVKHAAGKLLTGQFKILCFYMRVEQVV